MNILIIGGAGFLGANLVRRCLQDPANKVTVLDLLDPQLKALSDELVDIEYLFGGEGSQGFPFLSVAPLTATYLAWVLVWVAMVFVFMGEDLKP